MGYKRLSSKRKITLNRINVLNYPIIQSIFIPAPTNYLPASNVTVFINGVNLLGGGAVFTYSSATEKPNAITQIRVGSDGTYGSNNNQMPFRYGWDGQISEIRITRGRVYNLSGFTPPTTALDQVANATLSTVALFKATSTQFGDQMSNQYITPSGAFSINSADTKNGLLYSLDVRNRANISGGLVFNGIKDLPNWPITIEYWARANSNSAPTIPVIFRNDPTVIPGGPYGTFFTTSPSIFGNMTLFNNGVSIFQATNVAGANEVKANTWVHYAVYIQ